ncbi:hypothetical protein [Leuconostoc citreum]|uniref:hypothetical protein n=1 Tax=Leuconostoc citreum TaxID=33964 RepID=UPI0032E04D32
MSIYQEIEQSFDKLDSNSQMLKFILARIKSDKYRGNKSAQHNRYDISQLKFILHFINENNNYMPVPPGDSGNFPEGYQIYIEFAKKFANRFSKGNSENTIKKNIFPDMETMGFIKRDNNSTEVTKLGLEFSNANTINSRLIYSGAINRLFEKWIDTIISLLSNYEMAYVTKYEVMFFVSAIGNSYEYSINLNKCVQLIHEFRQFGRRKKETLIHELKTKLIPLNFKGKKNVKRDFGNWNNKIDQFLHLIKENLLLEFDPNTERIYLRGSIKIDSTDYEILPKKRSTIEKHNYFEKNNIKKLDYKGFELHHIIGFSEAKNLEQLSLIDNWQNMLFIDGTSHNTITQSRKKYYYVDYNKDATLLSTPIEETIILKYNENIGIKSSNLKEIKQYNTDLLELLE